MRCNEATWDRAARLIIGTTLTTVVFAGLAPWPVAIVGLLQVATGISGYCVLYRPFGIDTTRWFRKRDASASSPPSANPHAPHRGAGRSDGR